MLMLLVMIKIISWIAVIFRFLPVLINRVPTYSVSVISHWIIIIEMGKVFLAETFSKPSTNLLRWSEDRRGSVTMERQHCHMSSDEYYMHSGHHYI